MVCRPGSCEVSQGIGWPSTLQLSRYIAPRRDCGMSNGSVIVGTGMPFHRLRNSVENVVSPLSIGAQARRNSLKALSAIIEFTLSI